MVIRAKLNYILVRKNRQGSSRYFRTLLMFSFALVAKSAALIGLIAIFTICLLLPSVKAEAAAGTAGSPSDFLIHSYSIELTVDNLAEAFLLLEDLPGFNIQSWRNGIGGIDRRVDNRYIDYFLASLRDIGDITHSTTHVQNVFSSMSNLEMELQVRNTEHTRLMELLYEVDTLENFRAVENRLVQVIGNIERINGQLNHYALETSTSRVDIFLSESGPIIEIQPTTAFGRVGNAFVNSASITLSMIQWGLLILAYISIPLAVVLVFGGGITLWVVKCKNKKEVPSEDVDEIAE